MRDRDADFVDGCRTRGGGWRDEARVCEVRESRFALKSGSAIAVDGGRNGGVEVEGWEADSVVVHARVQAWAETEADARAVAKEIVVQATGPAVRATGPERGRRASWAVTYDVLVPRSTNLTLTAWNGPVSVRRVRGRMELAGHNGPVALREVAGDVTARTANGPIAVTLAGEKWDGKGLDAETRNGPVTLDLPAHYAAHLETGTVNGPMRIDFPVAIQGDITRQIRVDLNGGGPTVRAVTTNGPVSVRKI